MDVDITGCPALQRAGAVEQENTLNTVGAREWQFVEGGIVGQIARAAETRPALHN